MVAVVVADGVVVGVAVVGVGVVAVAVAVVVATVGVVAVAVAGVVAVAVVVATVGVVAVAVGVEVGVEDGVGVMKQPRLCFVHIPRTGGNTVRHWFGKPVDLYHALKRVEHQPQHGHPRLFVFPDMATRPEYRFFSVVRNPWAWHVSWYFALQQHRTEMGMPQLAQIVSEGSFTNYLRWIDSDEPSTDPACYPRWQLRDWLRDEKGDLVVSTILRNERLLLDAGALWRSHHDARRGELPPDRVVLPQARINSTSHQHYSCYYNEETIQIVTRRHAQDIADFGYYYEDYWDR